MHLDLFWLFSVMVLNPCVSVFGVLSFFLLELQQFSSEKGIVEMLPLAGFFL
jgi:hypothetical protein